MSGLWCLTWSPPPLARVEAQGEPRAGCGFGLNCARHSMEEQQGVYSLNTEMQASSLRSCLGRTTILFHSLEPVF